LPVSSGRRHRKAVPFGETAPSGSHSLRRSIPFRGPSPTAEPSPPEEHPLRRNRPLRRNIPYGGTFPSAEHFLRRNISFGETPLHRRISASSGTAGSSHAAGGRNNRSGFPRPMPLRPSRPGADGFAWPLRRPRSAWLDACLPWFMPHALIHGSRLLPHASSVSARHGLPEPAFFLPASCSPPGAFPAPGGMPAAWSPKPRPHRAP
jgi:hypothetical protein